MRLGAKSGLSAELLEGEGNSAATWIRRGAVAAARRRAARTQRGMSARFDDDSGLLLGELGHRSANLWRSRRPRLARIGYQRTDHLDGVVPSEQVQDTAADSPETNQPNPHAWFRLS